MQLFDKTSNIKLYENLSDENESCHVVTTWRRWQSLFARKLARKKKKIVKNYRFDEFYACSHLFCPIKRWRHMSTITNDKPRTNLL